MTSLRLTAAVLLFLPACAMMGEIVPVSERTFTDIREVPLTKKQIYDRSLEWMARTFVSSKSVIELKDPEAGKIIGKGITTFTNGLANIPCRYTMIIEMKDNRYRTTFTGLTGLWGEFAEVPHPVERRAHLDELHTKLWAMEDEMFQFVTKKNDDW